MAETVKIPIELQLEKIGQNQAELNKFVSNIQGQLNNLQKEAQKTGSFFSGLGGNLIKAFTGLGAIDLATNAIGKLANVLAEPIKQASEAEDSMNGLNTALALSGKYTEDAANSFGALASEIQNTTTVGDDAVIQAASLIQTMGRLDQEGLKRATAASVDLAAALKIDLQTASQLVGKAAEGNISAFKRYGIEIKQGKTDAETLANTLGVLEGRFKGAAAAQANTFSGALAQLGNVFGDLQEEIGKAVVKNGVFIQAIKVIKEAISNATPAIADLAQKFAGLFVDIIQLSLKAAAGFVEFSRIVIVSLQDTIIAMNKVFTLGGKLGKGLSDTFNQDSIKQTTKAFEGTSFALLGISDAIDEIKKTNVDKNLSDKFKEISKSAKNTSKDIDNNLVKSLEQLDKQLETAGLTNLQKFRKEADDRLKIIQDSVKAGIITREQAAQRIAKSELEFSQKTAEEQKKLNKEVADEREKELQASQKRAAAFLSFDLEKIVQEIVLKPELDTVDITNLAAGFIGPLKKGAEGAVDVLAKGAGLIAETFLPGIGKAVAEIFSFLAQGATKIKEQITGFVSAIPDILFSVSEAISALPTILIEAALQFVTKLIEGLPRFIERLFNQILYTIEFLLNKIPEFIVAFIQRVPEIIAAMVARVGDFVNALIAKIPDIINGFVLALPAVVQALIELTPLVIDALVKQSPSIALALGKALIIEIPLALGKALLEMFIDIFRRAGEFFANSISRIFDPIINFFKNIPGIGEDGLIPDSIPILGRLATGGTIPTGFPNDTFPAKLTSGEMVVPTDDVTNLRNFLANERQREQSSPSSNNDIIMTAILKTLQRIENKSDASSLTINVGNKTIVDTLRNELKSGRVVFA